MESLAQPILSIIPRQKISLKYIVLLKKMQVGFVFCIYVCSSMKILF